jgi:hypothetical protein
VRTGGSTSPAPPSIRPPDLHDFTSAPQTRKLSDIHCVTSWSRYDNHWDGVTTQDLTEAVQPTADATHVLLTSSGYDQSHVRGFYSPEAILRIAGRTAPALEHGGPVRLVVPHLYSGRAQNGSGGSSSRPVTILLLASAAITTAATCGRGTLLVSVTSCGRIC